MAVVLKQCFDFLPPLMSNLSQKLTWGAADRECALINLAHVYRKQKRWPEAVDTFEQALGLCPGQASTYAALAFTYHLQVCCSPTLLTHVRSLTLVHCMQLVVVPAAQLPPHFPCVVALIVSIAAGRARSHIMCTGTTFLDTCQIHVTSTLNLCQILSLDVASRICYTACWPP